VNPTTKIQYQPHLPDGPDQAICGQDQPKENSVNNLSQKDLDAIAAELELQRKAEEASKTDPVL